MNLYDSYIRIYVRSSHVFRQNSSSQRLIIDSSLNTVIYSSICDPNMRSNSGYVKKKKVEKKSVLDYFWPHSVDICTEYYALANKANRELLRCSGPKILTKCH